MRPISPRVKKLLDLEPDVCARRLDGGCAGRLTREHALIYGGRQIDEAWAILKLCARHHSVDEYQDGGLLDKQRNEYLALKRATPEDLAQYPRVNWQQKLKYLENKYA